MSKVPSYLLLSRHSIWYFRFAVPEAVRPLFGCRELRRSLQTRCKREALIRSRELLEQSQALITEAFQGRRPSLDEFRIGGERPKQGASWAQWVQRSVDSVDPAEDQASTSGSNPLLGPALSKVMEEYGQRQRLEGVSEKTISDKRSVVDLLVRIVGDLPISHVTRKDAQRFRETALKLPPRINQLPHASLKKIIAEATTTISLTTFNNYVKNLTTLFTFAQQEGYCGTNPFDGLRVKQRGKVNAQRSRFTEEDLRRIFSPSVYEQQGQGKAYRYWLPLLGLYTGARLNELCQLYLDDVIQVDGIDCLHIRASRPDQKLKNPTSERLVPIHTRLKELGFLDYVRQQRDLRQERVFSELVRHKRHGYGATPSKWFARYRDQLGFKGGEEKKDFHSFRHTVADHLKQLGVAESLIGGLLGHQTGGITFSRYGKDFKPELLVPVVELITF